MRGLAPGLPQPGVSERAGRASITDVAVMFQPDPGEPWHVFERLLSATRTVGPSRKGTYPGCHPGRWGCWGHLDAGLSVSLAGAHTAGGQRQGHGTRFSPGPAAPWDVWP